jgi:Stage II sporulation protein E (SpoIIE)
MPRSSLLVFLLGVAALFAGVGAITDSLSIEQFRQPALLWCISFSVGSALLWAFFGSMQMRKALIAVAIMQVLLVVIANRWFPRSPSTLPATQLMPSLLLRDNLAMFFIFVGYALFIAFFRREGKRFFAVHTEMQLATEIQQHLVPPIAQNAGDFEIYGISVPSGKVGGDLVDVIVSGGDFFAYVADVSGHGVSAGVLMSMVKSAVRMRIASVGPDDPQLLPRLNNILLLLTSPSTYLTFAYVSGANSHSLQFSLAAHVPLFHYQSRSARLDRVSVENLPVGMFPNVVYQTGVLNCDPGDMILVVTDGLVEIFDKSDAEIGSGYIDDALRLSPSRPLSAIGAEIMRRSELYGPISDDRSLLLIRCLPTTGT